MFGIETAPVKPAREPAVAETPQHLVGEPGSFGGNEIMRHRDPVIGQPAIARANRVGLDFESDPGHDLQRALGMKPKTTLRREAGCNQERECEHLAGGGEDSLHR